MKTYDDLKALIEQRGVHPEFGDAGEGWGLEQSPHELAVFLVRMQELGVASVLEIGTGYKGGLSRFLAQDMGWDVTTVDIKNYGHVFEGVHYVILPTGAWNVAFDEKFDLVFIDGDHKYESVERNYLHYGKFANRVIAFHDIAGLRDCRGVLNFWNEIAYQADGLKNGFYKVIQDSRQCSGIGWVDAIEYVSYRAKYEQLMQAVFSSELPKVNLNDAININIDPAS